MTAGPRGCDGRRVRYRVVIRGQVSDRLASAFPGATLERGDGQTVLRGPADDGRLEALLDRLRDLGMEPVSCDVER